MFKQKIFYFILIICSFFLIGYASYKIVYLKSDHKNIKIITHTHKIINLNVELATTHTQHQQGLSGRKTLPENSGMLFIFPQPEYLSFWMKDMRFPIDMLWADQQGQIIYIKENLSPCLPQKPCLPYTAPQKAQYVLEVKAGFVQKFLPST